MTNFIELDGNIREMTGHGVTRKLLKNDRIPAVIYGHNGENINIDLDIKKFETEYYKGDINLKLFKLKINGKTYTVIPYQIDVHPVSDRPRHIDFMSVEGKKEIKVMIPLKCINKDKSPGIKKGGYLNMIKRKLQLYVDPMNIPDNIIIDCNNLLLKQSVKISNIKLPENTRPVTKKDIILVTITGRGKNDVLDTQAAASAGGDTAASQTTTAAASAAKKK